MDQQSSCCTECGFTSNDMILFTQHVEQHERQMVNTAGSESNEQSTDWTEENVDSPTSSPRDSLSSMGERSPPLILNVSGKAEKRAHVCPHCNFTTFMSQHMKSHLEAHERHQGQMYQCDICQMQFSQKANMHRHRMRHSGVKPYECRYCKKRFFRKDQMQEHSMTHIKTGADFDCPVHGCPAVFTQHSTLRTHLDEAHIISPSAPASCKLCTLLFSNSRRLLLHYQTKHDDSEASAMLRAEIKREPRKKRTHQTIGVMEHNPSPPQHTILPTANIMQPIPLLPSAAAMAAALQSHIQQLVQKGFTSPLQSLTPDLSQKQEYERPYLSSEELLVALSNTAAVQQALLSDTKESVLRMWAGELSASGLSSLPSPTPQSHSPSVDSGASSGEGTEDSATKDALDCTHCGIVFFDRTLQLLHKGLHSEHEPWRCNLCGHLCADKYMFTTHIISSNHVA
ncbi:unnamed protein product, partial [Mesorhabditis belari]|uniref:C2H2-type domain-containing protein n=1 Tax=Mesorhabditis belari TaxID=2138241 RepID=A0AAF3FHW5_9BILA